METHLLRIQEFASKRLKPTSAAADLIELIRSMTHGDVVHTDDRIQIGRAIFRFVDAQSAAMMCRYIESYFEVSRHNPNVHCED